MFSMFSMTLQFMADFFNLFFVTLYLWKGYCKKLAMIFSFLNEKQSQTKDQYTPPAVWYFTFSCTFCVINRCILYRYFSWMLGTVFVYWSSIVQLLRSNYVLGSKSSSFSNKVKKVRAETRSLVRGRFEVKLFWIGIVFDEAIQYLFVWRVMATAAYS